jgi:2-dehydropantoate 2-reductase
MNNKIGILGLGAIGSVIASYLNDDLYCSNRSPKKFIKIKRFNNLIDIPIVCQTRPDKHVVLDWLIICLKEYQISSASLWFENLISINTKVVVIRNGLEFTEPLLPYTSSNNILGCIIDCPTQLEEDGFYHQYSKPKLILYKSNLSNEFKQLFNITEIEINLVQDFKTASWKKVCESSALGSILCLSGKTCEVFEYEKNQKLYTNILGESIDVAIADGARIEDSFRETIFQKTMSYPKTKGSSMLSDRLNENPIEINAKNGLNSRFGKIHGIETPLNDKICLLLKDVNANSGNLLKQLLPK